MSDGFGFPNNCGKIAYEVLDSQGRPAPSIVILDYADGESTFSVEVDAKDYQGIAPETLDLFIVAKLINYYPMVPSVASQFTVTVLDPCETTVLTGKLELEGMTVEVGKDETFVQSVDVLSDSVSDDFSAKNSCGMI